MLLLFVTLHIATVLFVCNTIYMGDALSGKFPLLLKRLHRCHRVWMSKAWLFHWPQTCLQGNWLLFERISFLP